MVKVSILLGGMLLFLGLIVLGLVLLIKYFIRYNAKIKNSNTKENNEIKKMKIKDL